MKILFFYFLIRYRRGCVRPSIRRSVGRLVGQTQVEILQKCRFWPKLRQGGRVCRIASKTQSEWDARWLEDEIKRKTRVVSRSRMRQKEDATKYVGYWSCYVFFFNSCMFSCVWNRLVKKSNDKMLHVNKMKISFVFILLFFALV